MYKINKLMLNILSNFPVCLILIVIDYCTPYFEESQILFEKEINVVAELTNNRLVT